VAAGIIAQRWGKARIAILHDNSAFGRGLADATNKALEAQGVHPAIFDAITPGEKDYNGVITRLKQAGIDLVYYGGYQQEAGLLVRQAKEQGFGGQFFMTSGIATTEFAQIAGPAADGVLFTFNPDARKRPEAAPIVADFKARGIDPQGFTLYGYAAVQVLTQAANDAKSADPKPVAAALHADSFDTVLGPARFDAKGDITAPGYRLYVWRGGNFDYAEGS
jgi:branched-chain amino acid transport system substrate-binding protein